MLLALSFYVAVRTRSTDSPGTGFNLFIYAQVSDPDPADAFSAPRPRILLPVANQILMSSRWYGEPGEFAMRKAGMMTTVGVLVYLDGSRPFRSWDGDMVRALVSFSVDGRLVRVATGPAGPAQAPLPAGGGGGGVPPAAMLLRRQQQQQQPGLMSPVVALPPPQLQQASATLAASAAAYAAAGPGGGGGVHVQQEHGEEACLSPPPPPPGCPPVEEVAPWEVAAAGAAAAAAATSGARLIKKGGGGGGGAGTSSGAAAPALGIGQGGGAMLPAVVPETSAALGLALPKDRDLFPTVTIHSPNTEVCFLRRVSDRGYLFLVVQEFLERICVRLGCSRVGCMFVVNVLQRSTILEDMSTG